MQHAIRDLASLATIGTFLVMLHTWADILRAAAN